MKNAEAEIITDPNLVKHNATPLPKKNISVEQTSAYKLCQQIMVWMLKESEYWGYAKKSGWYARLEDYMINVNVLIVEAWEEKNQAKKVKLLNQCRITILKAITVYRPLVAAFNIDEGATLITQIIRLKNQVEGWLVTTENSLNKKAKEESNEKEQT